MKFTEQKRIKKQVTENLITAEEVYSKIRHYISHAKNIYWCRNLNLAPSFQEDDYLNNLKVSMPSFIISVKEFQDIYFINQKLCSDYPKMLEYSNAYFERQTNNIHTEIIDVKKDIKQLDQYSYDKVLRNAIKLLDLSEDCVQKHLVEKLESQNHTINQ